MVVQVWVCEVCDRPHDMQDQAEECEADCNERCFAKVAKVNHD
jgi:hypothetical protein